MSLSFFPRSDHQPLELALNVFTAQPIHQLTLTCARGFFTLHKIELSTVEHRIGAQWFIG